MLYGKTPWTAENIPELLQNIQNKPLDFGDNKGKEEIKLLIKKMLTVNTKERIGWKEIFGFSLFQDELPKISSEPKGYEDLKNIFMEYVKTNIVKSYLRFNMQEVDFKEPMEPTNTNQIELIKTIHAKISHKRNIAFMYAYMLVLYYKNTAIMPPTFNQNMEFEFSLVMKALSTVNAVGAAYFNKDPV